MANTIQLIKIFSILVLLGSLMSCRQLKKLTPGITKSIIKADRDESWDEADSTGLPNYTDSDGDGISDADDRCPNEAGNTENMGCPILTASSPSDSINDGLASINDENTKSLGHSPFISPTKKRDKITDELPKAFIAYGYKNKMKVGSTMDIRVRVELNSDENKVSAALKKVMNEKKAVRIAETDSTITKTLTITVDKYFRIIPKYDTSIFHVDSITNQTKELNLNGETNWSWRVKARQQTGESNIELIVYAIDENGIMRERDNGVMYVMITVDSSSLPAPPVPPTPPEPVNQLQSTFLPRYGWALITASLLALCVVFFMWKKGILSSKKSRAIYFSYAWDQEEQLIDKLYESLKKDGFYVVRDKADLRYKGFISKFMTEIGTANYVIVAISDKYLKSRFCMFELYEIYRNTKMDKEEFTKRLFPLRVENINLNDPDIVNGYINYWELEEGNWDKRINENSDNITPEQTKQYHIIKRLVTELTGLLNILADINVLNNEQLLEDDFAAVKTALKNQFNQ